jgi:hypothetical protein
MPGSNQKKGVAAAPFPVNVRGACVGGTVVVGDGVGDGVGDEEDEGDGVGEADSVGDGVGADVVVTGVGITVAIVVMTGVGESVRKVGGTVGTKVEKVVRGGVGAVSVGAEGDNVAIRVHAAVHIPAPNGQTSTR